MIGFKGDIDTATQVAQTLHVKDISPKTIICDCGVENIERIKFRNQSFVLERTGKAEQDYDGMDDGIPDCRSWRCSCGASFPFWRGLIPSFCSHCGIRIVR